MVNLAQSRRERTSRLRKVNRQSNDFYPFSGGLNLIESPLSSEPGQCQSALNYEMGFEGGYRRVGGYEVFDGSPSNADQDYYKLPIAAIYKPTYFENQFNNGPGFDVWGDLRQTVWGMTNGGRAQLLDVVDSGGYGQNHILMNGRFGEPNETRADPVYWDPDPYSTGADRIAYVFDGDWIWPNGSKYGIHALSRLQEINEGSASNHYIRAVGQTIAIAEGDMLYVSVFAKFKTAHSEVSRQTDTNYREGIRLQIAGTGATTAFGGAGGNPYVDYRIDSATVVTQTNHIHAAGVDILEDDVLRLWFRTRMAEGTSAGLNIEIGMLDDSAISYQGTTYGYVHCSGLTCVLLPGGNRNPHNGVLGIDNFNDTDYWTKTAVTVSDASQAWGTSKPYDNFSRVTPTAVTTGHEIGSEDVPNGLTTSHISFNKGDRIHIEFYAKVGTGSCDGVAIFPGAAAIDAFTLTTPSIYINLKNGGHVYGNHTVYEIADYTITEVETDIYLVKITTNETIRAGRSYIVARLLMDNGGEQDALEAFDGTAGQWLDIAGVRVEASSLGHNEETKFGVALTTTATKNVNTGELILGGSCPGFIEDGEVLRVEALNADSTDAPDPYMEMTEFGVAAGNLSVNSETNSTLETAYQALVATNAALVSAVPGSGPIRGVWIHRGIAYCFRDSLSGDRGVMYQASGMGWKEVGNLWEIGFDSGSVEPSVGDDISDTTTGAGARVRYVDTRSGTWGGADAAGVIYCEAERRPDETALFTNNNNLDNDSTASANFATIDDVINGSALKRTLPPGGRYELRNDNLYGSTQKQRMYFVNGVGTAMEFDGIHETLRIVVTGMTEDKPTHLAIHNYHLFLSFPGGSVQLSGDGNPHSWTVITGASEISVGDEISGFNEEVGNSLFIYTRDKSFVLQGNTRANFDLDDFNINAGAHEWSVQRIGLGLFFDDRGFTTILQTQRAGSVNFQENAQSELIQPLVEDLVRNAEVTCSHLIRNQNIYRCYFDDGRIVSIGFSQHKVSGHMPLRYPFVANCACSEEDGFGAERILVGTTEGEVFELEKGVSFAGDDVRGFIRSVLYHSKSPGKIKKYSHCRIDGTFRGALTMAGQIEYDFGDPGWNLGDDLDFSNSSAGGYWDDMVWDEFVWDQAKSGNPQVKIDGEGTNISIYLYSTSKVDKSHTLRGATMQWTPRRDDRRTT